jgi:DNA-binding response OmpR family regulator
MMRRAAGGGRGRNFFDPEGENLRSLEALGGMDHHAATILVVEDHRATRVFLADNLTADGFEVLEADCASDARRLLQRSFPDLAIVDLGLPDGDGLELLAHVRGADRAASRLDPDLPMLVLSGRVTELDRLRGFRRGCDDYVVKPFSYFELSARMRALLRRTKRRPESGRMRIGSLELDPLSRQVWLSGEPVALSKKEYALLRALAGDPTRVFTREELLRGVWGFQAMGTTRTLDSHAFRLRQKLNRAGDRFVVNVWGVGYRLVDGSVDG